MIYEEEPKTFVSQEEGTEEPKEPTEEETPEA